MSEKYTVLLVKPSTKPEKVHTSKNESDFLKFMNENYPSYKKQASRLMTNHDTYCFVTINKEHSFVWALPLDS